jgi:pimeloyl-ACP methyl ester carboxylesterase
MTFVLIPGAGIDPGAWCWTVAELEVRGHRALAPWLPLNDPDAGPSDHAEAVIEAVRQLRGPLVVVGQSLGAFAATLVAARIGVSELVLLAPMVPAPGESAGDWWTAVEHDEAIAPLIERLGPMSAWGPELAPRDDRLFPLAFQRRVVRERLGLPVEEMPGGHVPMLARPGELADRLAAISDAGAGGSSPLSR